MIDFDRFISTKSYVDGQGHQYGEADQHVFSKFIRVPDPNKTPHAFRWYMHIASLSGQTTVAPWQKNTSSQMNNQATSGSNTEKRKETVKAKPAVPTKALSTAKVEISTPNQKVSPVDVASDGKTIEEMQDEFDALQARITSQGTIVRSLKKDGGTADSIAEAVEVLQALKSEAAALAEKLESNEGQFNRRAFDDLILRKMFVVPSFEIHGGVKGLFDLGPPACALKAAMIDLWRKHFVLNEQMLEMECTNLTPEVVLKTSGHVDRFTDLMVKDPPTGECFRADKLLEDAIDNLLQENPSMPSGEKEEHLRIQRQADAFSPEELDDLLLKYDCRGPSGEAFSPSFPFNLMFKTSIGPEGTAVGFLRPETAQGLFVNFRRLLDLNSGKTPFAAAQIGLGFRNEIAPRSGLLRVREFCMAEIEHFVNPKDKRHSNFDSIADKELVLFGREDQLGSGKTKKLACREAVETGLINNQTLAYFMARTQLFMEKIGMDPLRLRFRQHLATEMAHYAADCWDLEIKSSYGWVECVGHADRACYDLEVHSKATKTPMVATQKVDPPEEIEVAKLKFDRKLLGQAFKADQRIVSGILENMSESWDDFEPIATALEADGKTVIDGFEITREMVSWTKVKKKVHELKFTPSVIEPSFGMGRILYSLLEHSFGQREEDEQRCVMKFNPQVAPEKCAVLPISSNPKCNAIVDDIAADLMESDLATRIDKSSAALGRRYSRVDELGVPFAVTVDFQTLADGTVTMRERDSMKQIRLPKEDVATLIFMIVHNKQTWEGAARKYPEVLASEDGNTQDATSDSTIVESTIRGSFRRPEPSTLLSSIAPTETKKEVVAPAAVGEQLVEDEEERRMVAIMVKPLESVDPHALYQKIVETIKSKPEYKLKWDEKCKVQDGKIYSSFTIALEADFDEEVMEHIECMEDEVADQTVTYQAALE